MIDKKLSTLYEELDDSYIFKARVKTTRGLHNGLSRRRSNFVGVSKSKYHYQTLITHNRTKKYIGTFLKEEEAAITYDFYALGLNGFQS